MTVGGSACRNLFTLLPSLDFIGHWVKGSATFQSNLVNTSSVKLSDKRERRKKKKAPVAIVKHKKERKKIDTRNVKQDESQRAMTFQI